MPTFAGLGPPVGAAAAFDSPADMVLGRFEGGILDGLGGVSGNKLMVGVGYLRCRCRNHSECHFRW